MRAQRAFREFGRPPADRPLIRRSNIVVAEPLVTDDAMLKEFLANLSDVELGRVFSELVETLELAATWAAAARRGADGPWAQARETEAQAPGSAHSWVADLTLEKALIEPKGSWADDCRSGVIVVRSPILDRQAHADQIATFDLDEYRRCERSSRPTSGST